MKERIASRLREENIPCEMCEKKATCCITWENPFSPVRDLFLCVACIGIISEAVCRIVKKVKS